VILPFVLSLTLAAAAETAPTASPALLRVIGHNRIPAGACGNLVVHANGAISAALHNDQVLARAIGRLRSIDFENNALSRRNGLAELTRLAGDLHDQSVRGDDELHRLNDLAERATGVQRDEVTAFSTALSGAFAGQRAMASDLAGFINYLDYHEMRDPPTLDDPTHSTTPEILNRATSTLASPTPPISSPYQSSGTPNRMAQTAAGDFETRVNAVRLDEDRAAVHSEPAVSGCS